MVGISRLPDAVISRIAAGEVITSPANIIKELIENSLDANASQIHVSLASTLLELSVVDNGVGIDKEDLHAVCRDHCTSKITGLEDLRKCGSEMSTFGFRGEAMHAISHTARISVITRTENERVAFHAEYNGPELEQLRRVASESVGTTVEVSDIFHNNQLRKEQFYKNKTELMRCIELVKAYSASFPGIRLSVDGKPVVMHTSTDRDIYGFLARLKSGHWVDGQPELPDGLDRIIDNKIQYLRSAFLYAGSSSHLHYIASVMPYDNEETDSTVKQSSIYFILFSGKNLYFKKYKFILFVNKRMVTDDALKRRIGKLFRSVLGEKKYPFIFIELYIPFIDVNVHPSKAEVLFDEADIYDRITGEVERCLLNEGHREIRKEEHNDDSVEYSLVDDVESESSSNKKRLNKSAYGIQGSVPVIILPQNPMKIYSAPAQRTLEESFHGCTQSDATTALASVSKLISEIRDVGSSIFKNAVYVGQFGEFFYIQHHVDLIRVEKRVFLGEHFYHKILKCFGSLESKEIPSSPVSIDEDSHALLREYFGIKVQEGCVVEAPVMYGMVCTEWSGFAIKKTDEYSTFRDCAKNIALVYSKLSVDLKLFNLIKQEIIVTESILRSCKVITSLKDLYKQFGRC